MSDILTGETPIRIVDRGMATHILRDGAEWQSYPEIGEHDFERVNAELRRVATGLDPAVDTYIKAYEALVARAEDIA